MSAQSTHSAAGASTGGWGVRPEDTPAIELNRDVMERIRPEMKRFSFDPTLHKTYLEQLGIGYPTLRPATTAGQL